MMDPFIILGIYALFGIIAFGILIYLIIRRVKIKESENFEDRDN
ncbi:MAG: hypothetical protein AB8B74_11510 [Crocinitomicaceae bacterium]